MTNRSEDSGPRHPVTRPFVGGRPPESAASQHTFSFVPTRPFSIAGAERKLTPHTATSSLSMARPQKSETPLWTVAVYEPGLEHVPSPVRHRAEAVSDLVEASLALADDVREAQRHSSSLTAAATLELIAQRLRRGEILLLPDASIQTEAAVLSSVLAVLLGGRR